MSNQEFKTMLSELDAIQQVLTWWMVWRRWLFRPKRREWVFSETYPVVYMLE